MEGRLFASVAAAIVLGAGLSGLMSGSAMASPGEAAASTLHYGPDSARLNQFKYVEFVEEPLFGDLRKEPLK